MSRWTAEDIRELRELAAEGATQRQAADRLERTLRAVRLKARRSGVRFHNGGRPDAVQETLLLELLDSGYSVSAAARTLNRCRCCVQGTLRRLVKRGLVQRVGGKAQNARYRVVGGWR